jgi:nitrite reductase/ring-hydroxylating ferredoxin subunit
MAMLAARGDLVDRYGVRGGDGGPVIVPKSRYVDTEYALLERRQLWPHVWQMACLTTDVAEAGDWIEYRIADQSIIVLRDLEGTLRAFHNVCPHRGFKLCEGVGQAADGHLRCGYHGWRYDLDGAVREITSQRGFGLIDRDRYGLRPVRIGAWEQMVFVNPSPHGMPLDEFLDPLPQDLAPFELGRRVCTFRCTLAMQGNWKVTVDAFNEVYHLQGLHPQLLAMMDDVHTTYRVFDRGHSMMQIPLGVASPRLGGLSDEAVAEALHQNYGSMFGARGDGPIELADGTARDYAVRRVRERCHASGVDLAALRDDQVVDDFHYLAFPNLVFNTHSEMHTLFRARPGVVPGKSSFDFFLFHRLPSGSDTEGLGHGVAKGPLDHVDYPEGSRITEVLDQDLDGIARVHAGLLSEGIDEVSFADFECRLTAMHTELDHYLFGDAIGK